MTSPYGTGTVTPFGLSGNINIDALANIGIKWGSEGQGVGAVVTGPAIVEQFDATTVIPAGWTGRVDGYRNLILEKA